MASNTAAKAPYSDAAAPSKADVGKAAILPDLDDADTEIDSGYDDVSSLGATSISSSVLRGHFENGRRYQNVADVTFNIPSDDQQFESMHAGHLAYTVLESMRENPFFRAPISKTATHIIDVGTGSGGWANDVADMFPQVTVHGVDLYPPPSNWVAPNCIFEVDDCTRPWSWSHNFDLVHIRLLVGAVTPAGFKSLYSNAYQHLNPGGWIEHLDVSLPIYSAASRPLPPSSALGQFGGILSASAANAGTVADVPAIIRSELEAAGYINIHEAEFKVPIGDWSKHPIYREAGRLAMVLFLEGLEGWVTWSLTKWGAPAPWSLEEVRVYIDNAKKELRSGYHIYQVCKRVIAQKPEASA